jgi:large subunit ribosomal protein L25
MAQVLKVQIRGTRGKREARRQRAAGQLPAVLYGHEKEAVSLSISAEELETAIRHGTRLITLAGELNEQAFIRELQWNTWGTHVLHADFARVSEHEKVKVQVAVEVRGEAPGVKDGGVVKHLVHEVEIECEATGIPEKLVVNVNHLKLGDSITVAAMALPAGVTVLEEPDEIVVECVVPVEVEEGAEGAAGEAEPEIIGRKKEEGEEEE